MRELIILTFAMVPVCVAAYLWCTTGCAVAEVLTYTFLTLLGEHWFANRADITRYVGFCVFAAGLLGLLFVLSR